MRKQIYAVDFDGTLAITDYPKIIKPIPEVIEFCKEIKRNGHILILWTCRRDGPLNDAVKFCEEQGLVFDYINENVPKVIEQFGGDTRKIVADTYIDDRALNMYEIIRMSAHHGGSNHGK